MVKTKKKPDKLARASLKDEEQGVGVVVNIKHRLVLSNFVGQHCHCQKSKY